MRLLMFLFSLLFVACDNVQNTNDNYNEHNYHKTNSTNVTNQGLQNILEIQNSKITLVPKGMDSALYGTIKNNLDQDIKITGATSSISDHLMLMDTITENQASKMILIDELIIPAKGELILDHAGKHIMLMNPNLTENAIVDVIVETDKGSFVISAKIEKL